ncbi:MAG: LamG domain-containing protein [Phycisphaerae bacterium]
MRFMSPSVHDEQGPARTVLAAALMVLFAAGGALAGPVWCSPFETENNVAVIHQQTASVVDNNVGPAGQSVGGVSSLDPILYIQHGLILPGVPGAIDPNNAAANFCISTPDHRGTGINPNIPSNAGNLANAFTFEGYFLVPYSSPVSDQTDVARRLVTQKRSDADGQSRTAVGLHATVTGAVNGLFDYEGFNYLGPNLAGEGGGIGWNGPWVLRSGTNFSNYLPADDPDRVSIPPPEGATDPFPFTRGGSRFSATGVDISRPLSQAVNLNADGVTYLSALMRKTSTSASAGDNLEIGLATGPNVGATASTIRLGMSSPDRFFAVDSSAAAQRGEVLANVPYFIIVKIVSSSTAPDRVSMNVYAPGDTVPAVDPGDNPADWLISNTLNSTALLTHLKLTVGNQLIKGEVDEIRVGGTYESVIDPDAPLGVPGQLRNVLSIFWAEAGAGDPPAVINHMHAGVTPIEANTWYHFAMIYDGSDIRWYLNGQQEGSVTPTNLYVAGGAMLGIGNLSTSGAGNRGFFGLLDEIRIWDRALAVSELTVKGGGPGPNLLWRSRFETNNDQPATHQLAATQMNCIDNSAGPPDGTPAGIVSSTYAAYGQAGVPPVPDAIDPADLAGLFTFSMPNLSNVGINTNVPSNAGNLAAAVTVQGYFNSARTTPVGAGNALGSRLVSMMRSASQGQSRLAIGLAPNADADATHNVLGIAWADAGGTVTEVKGATPITPGTWYHFALVYDGTDVRWYLNGQQEGALLAPDLAGPGSAPIIIGNDRATGAGTRGFFGLIDKVVVSDVAIAPEQFMIEGFDACLAIFCNTPFADFDGDDDVDQADFAAWQTCFTGLGGTAVGDCRCFNREGNDEDVDINDLSAFVKCITGPAILWSQAVTPDCVPN